ncbi:MAG: transposase [Rudaea sp.]
MAEIGSVQFSAIALEVARAIVPAYRSKYSKHTFTQAQLLVILCLMRYEDWTFREAEVRLAEHRELREVLGLRQAPDYSTLNRFLQRVEDKLIDQVLAEVVRRLNTALAPPGSSTTVAVDATGLAQGAISTFFVHRVQEHPGRTRRHWLKWILVVDVPRRVVLAQAARWGPANDGATLRPLVQVAGRRTSIGLVLADAEFDSEHNHQFVRQELHARSVIPAKRGKAEWKITGVRAQMRQRFPRKAYRQRAIIESIFSSTKRKLSARAPGRSLETQRKQAFLLGLAYNLYRL